MFKNIKIQTVIIALFFLAYGCVSDEGNYNYEKINELNVTGIEAEYTVYTGDQFNIIPNIKPTLDGSTDSDRYEYKWVALNPAKLAFEARTTIATTKNLEGILKLPPAKYSLYYFIKDKVTGINWQQPIITLNVVSSIYEGWLVVGDVDGKARLDMVSIIPGIPQPRIINDVLDAAGSALKLSGKAVDVESFSGPLPGSIIYGIYVTASESGTARLEPDSFEWNQTMNIAYETVGGSFPTNFAVDFMKCPIGSENFLYKDGDIYYYNRAQQIRYGLPQNKVDLETKTFRAAPFLAETGATGTAVFFDVDLHRFLRFSYSKGNCSAMPPVTASPTVLDWNNTNCDLVYMTNSNFNLNENFAVLKNLSTGKFYLLRFNTNAVQTYYKEMLNAPDLNKATKFAVSPDAGYLFYTVGNKVYEYDSGTQSAKLMLDKGNEEITYLGFSKRGSKVISKLIVGSYSTTGKLELYTVPPVNGNLILENSYSGLCKIVDVTYRVR
ncbi:PKD-like family lipoprotein [Flavobacterium sp. 2]|uniref:PKD-like family lipoprotein n=1 Tax=Flavobacterium sp. 2 TaxID=308053 RepID=UPI000C17D170|nr:PKD-like family lipoprotein [Flavobacterium sp. 2]PIF71587.1 PKD family protein [Flavobacterium sp. 2]